jgi:drug/metabolite transporter (DMT)-like permease
VPLGQSHQSGMTWLAFALMTVASWGVYGVFLHRGQLAMVDPANGRFKAFLFVGIAYFLTAVLAPLAILALNRASWQFPPSGMTWSLIAGIVGAAGAFCVLLAFGKGGLPPVVMSIVFAGAPIVNALVAVALHPPEGGWAAVKWQFILGLLLAAAGGALVTRYAPAAARRSPAPHPPGAASQPHPR